MKNNPRDEPFAEDFCKDECPFYEACHCPYQLLHCVQLIFDFFSGGENRDKDLHGMRTRI